jgi:hypothetical protein
MTSALTLVTAQAKKKTKAKKKMTVERTQAHSSNEPRHEQVTEVMRAARRWARGWVVLWAMMSAAHALPSGQSSGNATQTDHPAEDLYLKLRGVGLDQAKIFRIRGASVHRPGFQISLEDGTIGFTADIMGRTTGAFFEGDGEVLLAPPNREERASMALGTGGAILEERFSTIYLRFNDDTFAELRPFLRAAEDSADFFARCNPVAQQLSEVDALRLMLTFSRGLPVAGQPQANPLSRTGDEDRFLHARVEGRSLGEFHLHFDTEAAEQVSAGQVRMNGTQAFYDIWTSFTLNRAGRPVSAPADRCKPIRYAITTTVHPPTAVEVEASLDMQVVRGDDRMLLFELSRFLKLKSVDVDGHPVEFIQNQAVEGSELARRGNDLVGVVFPEPLRAGDSHKMRFAYGGEVLSEAGGGLLYVGARGAWYPNRGLIPANFELAFRYPQGWTLVATGERLTGTEEADGGPIAAGEAESRWKTSIPSALAGFNLGKYVKASAHAGPVLVETYAARGVERTFPKQRDPLAEEGAIREIRPGETPSMTIQLEPSPARHAQEVADEAASAVDFLAKRFGPFPYPSLKLTQMPGSSSQGWPGLIFLSSIVFLSSGEEAGLHLGEHSEALRRLVLAHETAHQWWGDLVIWDSYRDQWIVEALANYCALMKMESEHPAQFREILDKYRTDLLQTNKDGEALMAAGPVTFGQRLSSSHFPQGYDAISYGRGTWLFHMLRTMMRDAEALEKRSGPPPEDEPFVRALRVVRERYAGKAIDTRTLLQTFAEQMPQSLRYEKHSTFEWFEQSWVDGTSVPRLGVRGIHIAPRTGGAVASGVLWQRDCPEDFVTSAPIYAVVGGKNVLAGRVFADGPETNFHLNVPAGTTRVLLDPYGTLLKRP